MNWPSMSYTALAVEPDPGGVVGRGRRAPRPDRVAVGREPGDRQLVARGLGAVGQVQSVVTASAVSAPSKNAVEVEPAEPSAVARRRVVAESVGATRGRSCRRSRRRRRRRCRRLRTRRARAARRPQGDPSSGQSCHVDLLVVGRWSSRCAQIGSAASRDAVQARPITAALGRDRRCGPRRPGRSRIWPHSHSPPMTSSTTAVWATSMPKLNAASAAIRCEVATPRLARLEAKPSPWTRPMTAAIHGRASSGAAADRQHGGGDDRQGDRRFDDPRRDRDHVEVGEAEADGVADGERGDELDGPPRGRPGDRRAGDRQGEHEQEQQVVGSEPDVVDAEIEERRGARPGAEREGDRAVVAELAGDGTVGVRQHDGGRRAVEAPGELDVG